MPVGKEPGRSPPDGVQPRPCRDRLVPQSLELVHGPPDEMLVDAPCEEVQPGAVEGPVVVDPAPDVGINRLLPASADPKGHGAVGR